MASCKSFLLYLRVTVILGLHALFVFLALGRALSDNGGLNWYVVFSPLFLFDLLSVVAWVFYLVSYVAVKRDEDSVLSGRDSVLFPGQKFSLLVLVAFGVGIPVKLTAEILLLLRLEAVSSIRVFVPAVLIMVLFLEAGLLAVFQALKPMLSMLGTTSSCKCSCGCCSGDYTYNPCHHCLGCVNNCFRRCLYHICVACMS